MESMNLPCGVVSHQKVGNFSSAIFPVSSKYIIFPPSTLFLANLSGCHAKIPLASFASIRRSISLNTEWPGALAVCFSTNISTTSTFSLRASDFNSVELIRNASDLSVLRVNTFASVDEKFSGVIFHNFKNRDG